ncbi:outer membrane beta-barrel protein [Myroides pelagicus]|uniref:Outer membrane beta-barrel protein n=1 Tax=Myroides pelagicus TaxID=270914 RepID=A0A7K1GJ12_9FLAO|nr:outer membrane beta-barrel protein [Myroides pelagicus]MEC4113689.1 outer membrane beta-barrel protein [Myroides pelagicus]MTH28885.1 outer membrane beta-barrel protein [Myroides pelagicus]
MRKYIVSLLLLVTTIGVAQDINDDLKGNTTFAIKGGWIQSTLKGDDLSYLAVDGRVEARNSFFGGLSVDNSIGKYFGLKHELFYQNQGASFTREVDEVLLDATLSMHSLRLNPISGVFKIGGLQVYGGPYVNMLLYSSITAVDEAGNTYKDHGIFGSTEDGQYLQKMDYGVVAGLEYQFKFGLVIGAQFTRGFASIFDNSNTFGLEENPGVADLKIYNQNFNVSIGYRF